MPTTHAYDTVHELALSQHGVFTTAQAKEMGVHPRTVWAMAQRGRIRRHSFGVYQDLGAPESQWTLYQAAALWPHGVRGVLSHETALSLMELSDVNPSQIHLTVPTRHRVRRREPPPAFVLHWADVGDEEIGSVEGLPVTNAARTIRDCARTHIGPALLRQAIDDGVANGWLLRTEADLLSAELAGENFL